MQISFIELKSIESAFVIDDDDDDDGGNMKKI